MKMEGHTREEIAQEIGCHWKTVANRLHAIRLAWIAAGLATPDGDPAA
jgi:hypothetical protein